MRPSFFRLSIFSALIALCCSPIISAGVVVYNISGSTTVGDNGLSPGGVGPLVDNMDGTFTLVTQDGSANNTNSFIQSDDGGPNNINSYNGSTLLSTDVVTVRVTVDGITGDLNANGIEFGISSGLNTFRGDPSFLARWRPNGVGGGETELANGFNGLTGNVNNAGTGVQEDSLDDGFTIEAIYDVNGITYTISDIEERVTNNPTQTIFLSAADILADTGNAYNFADVGTQNAYFNFQTAGTGNNRTATISEFSIEVSSSVVPEPSSAIALAFGGLGLLFRRRRS